MKFDELKLCMAIELAGRESDTPKTEQSRRDLAKRVHDAWVDQTGEARFPFSIDDIVKWDTNLRKQPSTRMKIDIATMHGAKCFWVGRGVGQCCEEVEAGHLIPRCRGGQLTVQNCVIECRKHNNERREKLVEEYIQSKLPVSSEASNVRRNLSAKR